MNWADVNWTSVEALATCATALIALGGVFFVTRQLKQVERTIRGDVSERLTSQSIDILKLLADKPIVILISMTENRSYKMIQIDGLSYVWPRYLPIIWST
jgi:hypothetical protein